MVADYYREQRVLSRISRNREEGFRPWEREVVARHHQGGGREFLVIGGGAGRESGALAVRAFFRRLRRPIGTADRGRPPARARERAVLVSAAARGARAAEPVRSRGAVVPRPGEHPGSRAAPRNARARREEPEARGQLSFSVHELEKTLALVDDSTQVEPIGGEGSGDFVMALPAEGPCYWHFFTRAEITELAASAGLVLDLLLMANELGDVDRANLMIGLCHRPTEHEARAAQESRAGAAVGHSGRARRGRRRCARARRFPVPAAGAKPGERFDPARLHHAVAVLARNVDAIRLDIFRRRRARDQTGTSCGRECARSRRPRPVLLDWQLPRRHGLRCWRHELRLPPEGQ